MHVEHHDLIHEFPEYKDAIHTLKLKDAHFAKLFDEYHGVTNEVEKLERADLPVNDALVEELKKRRVALKDELYHMLVASKA
jgi:uncharacterized protein YdcH (DUF465 family)